MKSKSLILILFINLFQFSLNSCKKESDAKPEKKPVGHKSHHVVRPVKCFPLVKTIIHDHCLSCHSANGDWSGRPVVFDTDQNITTSYKSIKSSVADPATFYNKRMPASGTLSQSEIDIIIKWFKRGGKVSD